jgi:hypothetical protein
MKVDHPVAEAAFAQQVELQAEIVGQGLLAASHDDRARNRCNSSTSPASSA